MTSAVTGCGAGPWRPRRSPGRSCCAAFVVGPPLRPKQVVRRQDLDQVIGTIKGDMKGTMAALDMTYITVAFNCILPRDATGMIISIFLFTIGSLLMITSLIVIVIRHAYTGSMRQQGGASIQASLAQTPAEATRRITDFGTTGELKDIPDAKAHRTLAGRGTRLTLVGDQLRIMTGRSLGISCCVGLVRRREGLNSVDRRPASLTE